MGNKNKTPSGWKRIKLGEYLTELSERNSTSGDNGVPVLSVTNRPGFSMSEEHFYKKVFSKDLSNYKIIQRGQFAYNPSRVNVGSIARLKEFDKGLLSPMYVTFETKKGLNAAYLDHWILSPRFRSLVKASTQGSVRNSLNFSALADFPFDLPPYPVQVKIVSTIDMIDSVIEYTQAIIDQAKYFKKGLMYELFTRGIPGRHKKFKKTKIGLMPIEWEALYLKDVVSSYKNGIYKHISHYGDGVPCIRMFNINDSKINSEKAPLIKVTPAELVDYGLLPGDILVNRVNSIELVGKAGIVTSSLGASVFESKNIRLRVNKSKCSPKFMNLFLSSFLYLNQMRRGIKAAVQQATINQDDLNRVMLGLPSACEQEEIMTLIDAVEREININEELIDAQQIVKSSILQILLSGMVKIALLE